MKLLLIGDERKIRRMAAWGFGAGPFTTTTASTRAQVEDAIEKEAFQVACVDWKMQEEAPAEIVADLRRLLPSLPIVTLMAYEERSMFPILKDLGICGYLLKPFAVEDLHALISTHALAEPVGATKIREVVPERPVAPTRPSAKFLTSDDEARRAYELAARAAKSDAAILLLGETGTGKTLLAESIHQNSLIKSRPFVTVNCPCLTHELLESELFGHVRGSFTGAIQDTMGKVAMAEGGTLFLDEIGELPMSLQPKLLRLLQEKQYERVGEATPRKATVRIIAATNRDLKQEVAAGRFREDLYYRLNVIAITVPPLRGRPAQIMAAARSFLDAICQRLGKPSPEFSGEATRILETNTWRGNLRELRNVVERAAILSNSPVLEASDFPALQPGLPVSSYRIGGPISLQALEAAHIRMVVASSSSLEEAARILEIDKSTLYRKRKQMESRVEPFEAAGTSVAPFPVAMGS